ncbi:MAG TPA: type II toxin-antitoxin system prevent-host-death family antitoxin [Aestuariivirga sp.]|nr:type II toxin-antitoxin system prevent-host-death family antitoxin [Aestuariivirga sp.]
MNKHTRVWSLDEASAKFSEMVRRAQTKGPQTVIYRGVPFARVTALNPPPKEDDKRTGADLIAAVQACPYPEFFDEIDRVREEERALVRRAKELLAKDDEEKRSRAQRATRCAHE